jgi:membrane protease YdiL (CAAX protease family)
MNRWRIPLALLVFLVWLGIMFWGAWNPHDPTRVVDTITGGISHQILSAGIFLLVVVIALRWWDVGFDAPRPWSSLRVVAFPAAYLALFTAGTLLVGWPAPSVVFFLALNCLLVGFSEELMFRGVLFRAFRSGMSLWPSIWLTSVMFGSVHVLNAFGTGDIFGAVIQACTAFMAGTFFLAMVLRTGSILPSMLIHAAWDFLLTTMAAGSPVLESAPLAPSFVTLLLPFALETPLFIYSIFVLRKIARETSPQPIRAAHSA